MRHSFHAFLVRGRRPSPIRVPRRSGPHPLPSGRVRDDRRPEAPGPLPVHEIPVTPKAQGMPVVPPHMSAVTESCPALVACLAQFPSAPPGRTLHRSPPCVQIEIRATLRFDDSSRIETPRWEGRHHVPLLERVALRKAGRVDERACTATTPALMAFRLPNQLRPGDMADPRIAAPCCGINRAFRRRRSDGGAVSGIPPYSHSGRPRSDRPTWARRRGDRGSKDGSAGASVGGVQPVKQFAEASGRTGPSRIGQFRAIPGRVICRRQ